MRHACSALVVERERQVREKEQRLQDVRAEARQAKREVKLIADTNRELTLANSELEASRYAAQVRVTHAYGACRLPRHVQTAYADMSRVYTRTDCNTTISHSV